MSWSWAPSRKLFAEPVRNAWRESADSPITILKQRSSSGPAAQLYCRRDDLPFGSLKEWLMHARQILQPSVNAVAACASHVQADWEPSAARKELHVWAAPLSVRLVLGGQPAFCCYLHISERHSSSIIFIWTPIGMPLASSFWEPPQRTCGLS